MTNIYAPNVLAYMRTLTSITISNVFRGSNGAIQFQVLGSPGDIYSIQSSSNLINWQTIASLTNASGTMPFTDLGATNYSYRFYRCTVP
jgi:hypothetical protein